MKISPLLALSAIVLLPHAVAAQVTRTDYERAASLLPARVNALVLNAQVTPNWIGESDRFWYSRELPAGSRFFIVDAAAGSVAPAFDHERMAAAVAAALDRRVVADSLPFSGFAFSTRLDSITFTVDSTRWSCTVAAPACRRLPAPPVPGTSPDGRWIAELRGHDLFIRSADGMREVRLTNDGAPDHVWATPLPNPLQMVRQGTGELRSNPAVWWSPDSRRIATYRIDAIHAGRLTMVEHAPPGSLRPRAYTYAYPLAIDSVLPRAEVALFEVETGARVPLVMPPIELQYYGGPALAWLPDGRTLRLRVLDRGYTEREFREIDGITGQVRVVLSERGTPYVDNYASAPFWFMRDGRRILRGGEDDGWMHLYLHDGSGSAPRQLTRGEWVVRSIEHVDEARGVVLFTAGGREPGRDPYLQHLYRMNLDGSGLRLLTPEDAEHVVSVSPTGAYFVDTYSRADLPPVSVLRRTTDGQVVRELERADVSRLLAAGYRLPEPFRAAARDGTTDIYGIIWRPSNFDATRSYPVVEQVYTGPHSFFVPKTFMAAARSASVAIAELGFIGVQVDGMGTARRSRAFHDVSYRNLGDGGADDRIAALRQVAARYPYVDLARVGIFGHSAGGYDAVRSMITRPDFYRVGVSSAGNHDHRLDKAVWNTQWMGWPLGEHYDEQSNIRQAHRIRGKLLLAHGDVDENVPVSATLQLADALIRADRDFDLIIMTGQAHGFGNHPYFVRKRWDFFVRHLHAVEPPEFSIR
jgi:dipeptidyl-peptidase 4